jgi:hypothetical protein
MEGLKARTIQTSSVAMHCADLSLRLRPQIGGVTRFKGLSRSHVNMTIKEPRTAKIESGLIAAISMPKKAEHLSWAPR